MAESTRTTRLGLHVSELAGKEYCIIFSLTRNLIRPSRSPAEIYSSDIRIILATLRLLKSVKEALSRPLQSIIR